MSILAGGPDLKKIDFGWGSWPEKISILACGPELKKIDFGWGSGSEKISILAGGPGRYSSPPPNLAPCQCMVAMFTFLKQFEVLENYSTFQK